MHNGNLVQDNITKYDIFNKVFTNITKVPGNLDVLPEFEAKTNNVINGLQFTPENIQAVLKNVNCKSAVGLDKINNIGLYKTRCTISQPLSIIFNKSLLLGFVPSCWKIALITPILKKGDKSDPCNYRRISLFSCLSKILKILICTEVLSHFGA